ncbi:MAG: hypothetical protein GQ535_17120 [Rhodobacteraceae bacterium]|nr:hypothetical protein [Paracoccaceae bacterium]
MTEVAQYSHDNMPMADILAEIRDMVSREAQARYDTERTVAKRELLILRPEARVDLLLQEAAPDIVVEPEPKRVTAKELKASLEAEVFRAKLQESFGISDAGELEELIRKVLRQELQGSL